MNFLLSGGPCLSHHAPLISRLANHHRHSYPHFPSRSPHSFLSSALMNIGAWDAKTLYSHY
ncbi:hypothetical protein OF83DRAFT_1160163 [Amylostereum chailletii]|nr:hypothetical protein OF83DRAFT_1160163 [Amylostereum chailletii]